jgi:hypothetical protein
MQCHLSPYYQNSQLPPLPHAWVQLCGNTCTRMGLRVEFLRPSITLCIRIPIQEVDVDLNIDVLIFLTQRLD